MTKVKFKVHTGWNAKKYSPGDTENVSEFMAKRWAKDGLVDICPKPEKIRKPYNNVKLTGYKPKDK